jgi:hypothetical protein
MIEQLCPFGRLQLVITLGSRETVLRGGYGINYTGGNVLTYDTTTLASIPDR